MNAKDDWKHGNYFYVDQPDAVAVFDDEDAECDSLYYRKGNRFSPCRTVFRAKPDHWRSVLEAWSIKAPLEDHRNTRTTPLP